VHVQNTQQAMRQTLAQLELTSTTAAHALVSTIAHQPPGSRAPSGEHSSPAERWCAAFNAARDDAQRRDVLRAARSDLAHLQRRRFAVGAISDGDDLRARIVGEAEGATVAVVALALRCTPTLVRRTRLAAGRDAEHGRTLILEPTPRALRDAGLSLRAIALATGVARSTLHDQLSQR
jgi:hypothetical protein